MIVSHPGMSATRNLMTFMTPRLGGERGWEVKSTAGRPSPLGCTGAHLLCSVGLSIDPALSLSHPQYTHTAFCITAHQASQDVISALCVCHLCQSS